MEFNCIFSKAWLKEKSLEILGNNDIDIQKSPGKVNLRVKCDDDSKYSLFKEIIKSNTPLGAKVTICKLS